MVKSDYVDRQITHGVYDILSFMLGKEKITYQVFCKTEEHDPQPRWAVVREIIV